VDDLEAIKVLKARYFRTMDTKQWDGMRRVFTDDVVMDTTESGGTIIAGADEFMTFLIPTLTDVVTVHHGHMPEIEVSGSTATGIWAMEDQLRFPDGRELRGYGHYHETYRKQDGTWLISSSKLTRLRVDISEPTAVAG
jgi:uncharacterized protein (TIGR02246 family)